MSQPATPPPDGRNEICFEKKLSFQNALKNVQQLVHPDLQLVTEALVFLDEEMIRFASRLANHTISILPEESGRATHDNVEQAVKEIFGRNMSKWAFTAGIKAVMSFRKAETPATRWAASKSAFPVDKIHEDVLSEKFTEEASVYLAAVLEYVCADALESAGNRASTSSRRNIMEKDVLYTLTEEVELRALFEIKKQKKSKLKLGTGTRRKKAATPRDSILVTDENGDGDVSEAGGFKTNRRLSIFKAFGRSGKSSVKASNKMGLDKEMSGSTQSLNVSSNGSPASSPLSPSGSSRGDVLRANSSIDFTPRTSLTSTTTTSTANNQFLSPSPDSLSLSSITSEPDMSRSAEIAAARRIADGSVKIRRLSMRHSSVGTKTLRMKQVVSPSPGGTPNHDFVLRPPDTNYQPYSRGGVLGNLSNMTEIKQHYPTSATSRLRVHMPGGVATVVEIADEMTMAEILHYIVCRRHLKLSEYTLKLVDNESRIDMGEKFCAMKISEIVLVQRASDDKQEESNLVCLLDKGEVSIIFKLSNGRRDVKAAKVPKLVEHIADDSSLDAYYIDTILLTFRSFIEGEDLFYLLVGRFKALLPPSPTPEEVAYYAQWKKPIQTKVVNFVIRWVERYFQDFYENKDFLDSLFDFCEIVHQEGLEEKANELSQLIAEQLQKFEKIHISLLPLEKSEITPSELDEREEQDADDLVNILEKDPIFIAEQLTIHNYELFNKVHRIEYVHYVWSADKMDDLCPNLNILISRFNKESYWVATQVCIEKEIKKRTELVKKFIMLAKHCMELQNYFSVFSVVGGLNMAPVQRLKKTWEAVPAKYKTMLQDLEAIMNPSSNMKAYRELALQSRPPMIPVLPVFVKDLFFINDGNEKEVDGLVNFEKLHMISDVVRNITAICSVPYSLQVEREAQRYFSNLKTISNTLHLRNESLEREPPATA